MFVTQLLSRLCAICLLMVSLGANAESIKVLTTGAYKQMVLALIPIFEAQTGHKVSMDNETAGELIKRVNSGEAFDVLILTPQALKNFAELSVVDAKSIVSIAKVGIGVAVKQGQALPVIQTVDDFVDALKKAKKWPTSTLPRAGQVAFIWINCLKEKAGVRWSQQKHFWSMGATWPMHWSAEMPIWPSIKSAKSCLSKAQPWSDHCLRNCKITPFTQERSALKPLSPKLQKISWR